MKILQLEPNDVLINPATRARKGEPSGAKVQVMAENFLTRREEGREHQLAPGIVRMSEEEQPMLVAGEHRLLACKRLNAALVEGQEPFLFYAVVVRADDQQALVDALTENELRTDATIFDRGDAYARLIENGLTQLDIAKRLNVSQASVSDALAANKLPKKIWKLVLGDGKTPPSMTEEAAVVFARIKDKELQEEVIQTAYAYQQSLDDIAERSQKPAVEDDTAGDNGDDTDAGEDTPAPAKKKTKGNVPVSDAVKNKKKGKAATKGKVGAEVAKKAARDKGAMKESEGRRTAKQLMVDLETLFGPNVEGVAASIRKLVSKLEEYLDKDIGIQGLKNSFMNCCLPDEEK